MKKLNYILIVLCIVLGHSLLATNEYSYYNTNVKSLPKKFKIGAISKTQELDTSTLFNGETVYIAFDNGSANHYQSTYRYNTINNITHQLSIFINFPYSPGVGHKNISISAPLHWNLTYLDPVETYRYCTDCSLWEFNFTQGGDTTYNITFLSGESYGVDYARQNQYLCIDEDPNSNLSDADFESGIADWTNTNFTSASLNNTSFWNDSNSLALIDSDAGTDVFDLNVDLAIGNYFIGLPVLVTSFVGTTISIQHRENSAWIDHLVDTSIINKWQRYFFYANITEVDGLRIVFNTGNGTILLDSFFLGESNIAFVNTNSIYQYNISSSLITWDLLKNYGISGITAKYDIENRPNDSLINSTSVTTNSIGYSSYLYLNSTLDTTELEVKAYSIENIFYNALDDIVILAHYDEGTGIYTYDSSGNNHVGELRNEPTWMTDVPDYSGYSLLFDSVDESSIDYGDNSSFSFTDGEGNDLPFSISLWIKPSSMDSIQGLVSKYGSSSGIREWVLYTPDGDVVQIFVRGTNTKYISANSDVISNDVWSLITVTYNGNETKEGFNLYVNSVLNTSARATNGGYVGMSDTTQIMEVGHYGDFSFNGNIDEVRIYNRELTAQEIYDYYNFTRTLNVSSSLYQPIQLNTSTVVIKEASSEWWTTSENDTFVYSYNIYGTTSTTPDLTHHSKTRNGLHTLTYIAYLDYNSNDTLFIPSIEVSTTILLDAPEVEGIGNLLKILIGVIPLLIIFMIAIFLPILFLYRMWIK